MLIQDVEQKYPPFHEPAGKAAYLIETGKFTAYYPPQAFKAFVPVSGPRSGSKSVGDYEPPPTVYFNCPSCDERPSVVRKRNGSPLSSVHARLRYRPTPDRCPDDVAATYLRIYKEWKSKSRRPDAPKLSAQSDERVIRAFGLKSRGELIVETVSASLKFPAHPPVKA